MIFWSLFLCYFGAVFNKTIITVAHARYDMTMIDYSQLDYFPESYLLWKSSNVVSYIKAGFKTQISLVFAIGCILCRHLIARLALVAITISYRPNASKIIVL